jgi:energy-coupling factor transporter transmembrane protein EcfT
MDDKRRLIIRAFLTAEQLAFALTARVASDVRLEMTQFHD